MWNISRSPLKLVPESLRLPWLISIDGDLGAGKTKLAKEIADLYAGTVVNVDDYLLENDGTRYLPYLDQINWEALTHDLQQNKDKNLVINGVLLEYVIERALIKPTYRIFIRHEIERHWEYSDYLHFKGGMPNGKTTGEVFLYYRTLQPWLRADEVLTLSSHYVINP